MTAQGRVIIKLIPKKDAVLYLIKNWRLITSLNSDYKIAARAIANRFKHVLPNLIDYDQIDLLKGRFIGEKIRLFDSSTNYKALKNIPDLPLFLDFSDPVEWSSLHKSYNITTSAHLLFSGLNFLPQYRKLHLKQRLI